MGERCVFLDRDNTIMDDPGYLTDPSAVRLLPGVDLALQSLAKAGYRLIVVTNQSAVARGLLSEESLERIHGELRRQLNERGVHLDAIYYCPFHPEGTIEEFARESEDRKPNPGMLLRAAAEHNIDLVNSWMIGDSSRDVEAGHHAGCKTIRVRTKGGDTQDEDSQADFTVRNLVDAARIIQNASAEGAVSATGESAKPTAPVSPVPSEGSKVAVDQMTDTQALREILRHLREMKFLREEGEFSTTRLAAAVFQILAFLALVWGAVYIPAATGDQPAEAYGAQIVVHVCMLTAGVLQLMALTFFIVSKQR